MDIDSFILYGNTYGIDKDIVEDIKNRPATSNYELYRPLPKGKNKKVIGLIKNELGEKVITKFVGLKSKNYSYLIDDGSKEKKSKRHKKPPENYNTCLEETQLDNKINYLEKNKIDVDSPENCHKELLKSNKLIKKETKKNVIQIDHKFLITQTEH